MSSRPKFILIVSIMMVILAGPALARDLWDPPWGLTTPNQTYQAWEYKYSPDPIVDNPYGQPYIDAYSTWPDLVEGPDGTMIQTLHIDEPGGLSIWVPNNPDPDLKKLIFWQMTSDKSPTPTGAGPTTTPPGTNLPSPYPQVGYPGGTWYTYNGLIEIRPNPDGEWIHFDLVPSTNIEEIVIKTVCIPEPATLLLLGSGLAGLLGLRRRFQS